MLEMALEYRDAVDAITADKTLKLRQYELDDSDWKIVSDVVLVLKVFKQATQYFSIDNKPSIAYVILTMDRINNMLADNSADRILSSAVCHALAFGRQRLDKYYSKTDASNIPSSETKAQVLSATRMDKGMGGHHKML
ncbi:hypothetical protein H0H92_009552 [Tricholoma furcatifolium]|nr:hypothetical protein H0H92_009552 [Tricholoma furcatifolium]